MPDKVDLTDGPVDLEGVLAALRKDYSKLSPRLRQLDHTVVCECNGIGLRLHFPSLRQGKATVYELVEAITHFLTPFSLPRTEVLELDKLYGVLPVDEFKLKSLQHSEKAKKLFIQANKDTNRNGEAGELLLYLLTEWILAAPQLIAKMSLKTNKNMPVHGADGIHVRYDTKHGRLILYWGESKIYSDIGKAIQAAISSIADAISPQKLDHELGIVQRYISFAGLDTEAKTAILRYLDPFEEAYNERHDITTCLIGFDFDAFGLISETDDEIAESIFIKLATNKLKQLSGEIGKAIKQAKLEGHLIEFFFLPVPSVQEFRKYFQERIGWKG